MNAVIFIRGNNAREIKKELAVCTAYASTSKINIVGTIYCDGLASSSPFDFEDFGKLLSSYLQLNGEIDMVIVRRLDRISRSKRMNKIMFGVLDGLSVSVQAVEGGTKVIL